MRLAYSHKNKLISLMRLTLRLFSRIKIFNLMHSHQTSRSSQISLFRIKYEFDISFKIEIWEKLDKNKIYAEDEIIIMGYLLMKKRRNHQQRKQWSEKYFCCITRCHSLSLDVPLFCLLINDPFSTVLSSSKVYQILFVHSFSMDWRQKYQMFQRSFFNLNNFMRILSE